MLSKIVHAEISSVQLNVRLESLRAINWVPQDSANENDKRKMVSGDILNDEASSDRKGGEGKNVSAGLLAETDTDQVLECVAGEEQINKHSSAEKAFQSQSLKWGIEMDSHEFPSDTLQGKDASSDSGNDRPVEMEKKTPNINELLQNTTADISVVEDSKCHHHLQNQVSVTKLCKDILMPMKRKKK